jgi:hypothetical protein
MAENPNVAATRGRPSFGAKRRGPPGLRVGVDGRRGCERRERDRAQYSIQK